MLWKISRTIAIATSFGLISWLVSNSTVPLFVSAQNLPDVGLPGRREGGATRSPCISEASSHLTALTPLNSAGKTISGQPTFFVYVPANTAQGVEIGLEDEEGNIVYAPIIQQNVQSGVVSFSFPQTSDYPPLEVGKNYKWYFQFICDRERDTRNDFVEGWVQRVEPSDRLKTQLAQASLSEQLEIYTQENLWYDRLETLANLRRSQPNDRSLTANWEKLLQEIQLGHLAQQPLGVAL